MKAEAISIRLKAMSALATARGFQPKGIDMTAEAITARLRMMSGLTDLCLRLGRIAPKPLNKPDKSPS